MADNLLGTGQDLDTSVNTIRTAFKLLRDWPGVCRKCATTIPLPEGQGDTVNIVNYDRFVASEIADATDITSAERLADTNTAYQVGLIGLKVLIPKTTVRRSADRSVLSKVGRMMEAAYRLKEDSDGTAVFSSWTPVVGGAGVVASPGLIAAASVRLDIGNDRTNPEPFGQTKKYGILHPLQAHAIVQRIAPMTDVPAGNNAYAPNSGGVTVGPGARASTDDILRLGAAKYLRKYPLADVDVYLDANIAVDANDDASGAVFDMEGFIFVPEIEPDLRHRQDDESSLVFEISGYGSYAWGLWRLAHSGVEVLADASLPTA